MSDEQRKFYEQRRQFYKLAIEEQIATKGIENTQFFVFQALNELRQIASIPESKTDGNISSPKVETLMEQLGDAISNGHKILIFVNYLCLTPANGPTASATQPGISPATGQPGAVRVIITSTSFSGDISMVDRKSVV